MQITAGHLQVARAAAIRAVTAQVSFDGGRNWSAARTRHSNQGYEAAFTATKACTISLRVTAADQAGDQISETILSAYAIS